MSPLFAILWLITALAIVFFIRRINLKNKASFLLGFRLILVSFLCGLAILAFALFTL
jgi:hypothetical protein